MIRATIKKLDKTDGTKSPLSKQKHHLMNSRDIKEVWYDEYGVDERTKVRLTEVSNIVTKRARLDKSFAFAISPYMSKVESSANKTRSVNNYWGFDDGAGYEQQIVAKINAAELLEAKLKSKSWSATPITIFGSSDCYQPIERKLKITRQLLSVFLKYKHPVTIKTKSALILRDIDLLSDLSKFGLVSVVIPINTLHNELHHAIEPRTTSPKKRMHVVKVLSSRGIPVTVLAAPIIPGLNDEGIFTLVKVAAEHGAASLQQRIVKLNGEVGKVFKDWVRKNFPYRWRAILRKVANMHQKDNAGARMSGTGNYVKNLQEQFEMAKRTYGISAESFEHNTNLYDHTSSPQMSLF